MSRIWSGRSYSYMDRAPNVEVDVNEDLESTLTVLGDRLTGVEVMREYDPNLPRITAYGGELNQVWTQLLYNALDAVAENGGPGRIRLRTACEADRVLVEVGDNGPGIPSELWIADMRKPTNSLLDAAGDRVSSGEKSP